MRRRFDMPVMPCCPPCRFCVYQSDTLVFESSQTMLDIPYGDCFTVEVCGVCGVEGGGWVNARAQRTNETL